MQQFFIETKKILPDLDSPQIDSIYEMVNDLYEKYVKIFNENSSIYLQVERFATLYSIEKYLINKFGLKS